MSVRGMELRTFKRRLCSALALTLASHAGAQGSTSHSPSTTNLPKAQSTAPRPTDSSRQEVSVEAGLLALDYKEDLQMPAKSTEAGTLPALSAHWRVRPMEDYFWELEVSALHARGTLDYAGSLQSLDDPDSPINGKPTSHTDKHAVTSAEALVAFPINHSEMRGGSTGLWARMGYEARFWDRGVGNFSELYRMSFVSASVEWRYRPPQGLGGSVEVGLRPLVRGDMVARMSELNPRLDNVKLPLGVALGAKVEGQVSYAFPDQGFRLALSSWYRSLRIGVGEPVYQTSGGRLISSKRGGLMQVLEPASRTHEFGVGLSGTLDL